VYQSIMHLTSACTLIRLGPNNGLLSKLAQYEHEDLHVIHVQVQGCTCQGGAEEG